MTLDDNGRARFAVSVAVSRYAPLGVEQITRGECMKLLDLFCGAGGCAKGYADAGFEVTGVDIEPMPRYQYRFIQSDALTFPLDGFDVINPSPPSHPFTSILPNTPPRR